MSIVKSLEGNVLEGWERGRTENGIPYYINHKEEATQWDHPEMTRILEELQKYNTIKYAAYRTAEKLRHLITALRLNLIRWTLVDKALAENRYFSAYGTETLNCYRLEAILFTLCEMGQTDMACTGQSAVHAELILNLILNMFDTDRKEGVPLLITAIVLGILCSGRLLEKYKYICHHFIDKTNFLMKKHIQIILQTLAKIPEFLGEKLSFGTHLVLPALESCCQQNCGLSEEGFLEWLFREPQTLVWMPTFARLKASELVIHPVRCSVCKLYPIVGLRYCCLHCLKYDCCQNCFFRGRISKGHKLTHQMREYCQPTSSWEETKTLLKALKNKLNRNGTRVKTSYLPIVSLEPKSVENSLVPVPSHRSTPSTLRKEVNSDYDYPRSPALTGEHQRELQSIIVRLEDENRHISKEIDKFHHSEGSSGGDSRSSGGSNWEGGAPLQRDFVLARQELLEDHAHQMELQIKRLKQLLRFISWGEPVPQCFDSPDMPLPLAPPEHLWMESTPLEGRNHIPPQQWSPFVKLQTELDNLERLTSGLQENSKNNFQPSKSRRSCRGVSFTDRLESNHFQRQGSVRPKMQQPVIQPVYSYIPQCDSLSIYDNCTPPFHRSHLPNGRAHFQDSDVVGRMLRSPGADSRVSLPQLPPPQKTVSHLDAELQNIIEQLERVLPNSSSPSLLPEEKAKVMQAVTEVEEAMTQLLGNHVHKGQQKI